MYDVIVLFNGYSYNDNNNKEMRANCSCTLIKGPQNIIVDTMTAWDGPGIIEALAKQKVSCENIDFVICTHGHSDHIGCNYLFLNATHIVGHTISKHDKFYYHNFQSAEPYCINEYVKLIATPGHTLQDVTVLVEQSNGDTIAITGDLFEKEEDLDNEKIWLDAGSDNEELQRFNRKRILEIADYIIPGHGQMFKNVYGSHKT